MEILLSAMLSCSDGRWILKGIKKADVSEQVRAELRYEILSQMPDNCNPGDYFRESWRGLANPNRSSKWQQLGAIAYKDAIGRK